MHPELSADGVEGRSLQQRSLASIYRGVESCFEAADLVTGQLKTIQCYNTVIYYTFTTEDRR